MSATYDIHELTKEYDVLIGGIGPSVEVAEFSKEEETLFNRFIEDTVQALDRISPKVADVFESQKDLFLTFAKIFKAKVNKSFGGAVPSPNSFGIGLLIPQDIRYVATPDASNPAYTDYPANSWTLSLTAGTAVYLLGSSTDFYRASPTVGRRAMFVIAKHGIIEIGTTPKLNQFRAETEKMSYAPFRAHTLVDQSVEKDYAIYIYTTPFAIPVWYDYGIRLSAMPIVSGTSEVRLLGVVYYEYGYHSALRYIA